MISKKSKIRNKKIKKPFLFKCININIIFHTHMAFNISYNMFQSNIKKMIFQNMENIFFNKNSNENKIEEENKAINDNNINNIKINTGKNININQYTLNPQQMFKDINKEQINTSNNNYLENLRDLDESNDKTEKVESNDNINITNNQNVTENEEKNNTINISMKKDRGYLNNQNEVVESKEYNINIDDFLKENTAIDEDIVNNATNLNIENSENIINNKNQKDDSGQEKNINNKNIKYAVIGNPELK